MKAIFLRVFVGVALASLAACTHGASGEGARTDICRALLDRVDAHVKEQGRGDAQTARVEGFPYLRVDRFLASFRNELTTGVAFDEWVGRLRSLDREARQVELQNASAAHSTPTIEECAQTLLASERTRAGFKRALIAAVRAPRHYDDGARGVGLYPLTQIGVALGFERWKAQNLSTFDKPVESGSVETVRYGLPSPNTMNANAIATIIDMSSQNALGVPDIEGSLLTDMARQFAPVFSVEERSNADRVGRPFWPSNDAASPRVDIDDPTVYVRLAHTRFRGEVLPQLVYSIWFPARPREGSFDLLGGELDGFVWRVTLGRDGKPLIYDSFHACGCYHLFFPVPPLTRREVAADRDLREAPLVPRGAPLLGEAEKLVLHVRSGSHYLSALSVTDDPALDVAFRLESEMQGPAFGLRSLRVEGDTRRSLFDPDGIIPGTERLERLILWPMGIASAGAMRQWGTHATAFVGERHGDDAFLFEEAFGP